jgi:hypothetical protein
MNFDGVASRKIIVIATACGFTWVGKRQTRDARITASVEKGAEAVRSSD